MYAFIAPTTDKYRENRKPYHQIQIVHHLTQATDGYNKDRNYLNSERIPLIDLSFLFLFFPSRPQYQNT